MGSYIKKLTRLGTLHWKMNNCLSVSSTTSSSTTTSTTAPSSTAATPSAATSPASSTPGCVQTRIQHSYKIIRKKKGGSPPLPAHPAPPQFKPPSNPPHAPTGSITDPHPATQPPKPTPSPKNIGTGTKNGNPYPNPYPNPSYPYPYGDLAFLAPGLWSRKVWRWGGWRVERYTGRFRSTLPLLSLAACFSAFTAAFFMSCSLLRARLSYLRIATLWACLLLDWKCTALWSLGWVAESRSGRLNGSRWEGGAKSSGPEMSRASFDPMLSPGMGQPQWLYCTWNRFCCDCISHLNEFQIFQIKIFSNSPSRPHRLYQMQRITAVLPLYHH